MDMVPPPSPGGRVPPNSEYAERALIGAALLDAERVIDLAIERQIVPSAFYYRAHETIWEVIFTMHSAMLRIDLITFTDRLRLLELLDQVGGFEYIERLVEETITAAHAESYIDIVHQNHLLREIIHQSRVAIDRCYDPDKDADIVLGETEQAFFNITDLNKLGGANWSDMVNETVMEIFAVADRKKANRGVPTGFKDLDQMLLGLQPSDMVVLAARPSQGKTSLALNIAENAALGVDRKDGKRTAVAVFSLEMAASQLVKRMICGNAGVSFHSLNKFLSNEHRDRITDAATRMRDLPIYIDDTAGLDVLDLRARARRMKKKYDIGLIIIDYLQLMNCAQFSRDGRQRETTAISSNVKGMAKELDIPVLVLSQLSRANETRDAKSGKPKLSDLRDSGSIEQDADVVLLLRRPSRYPEDPESGDRTLAIVDIAKHRNGGVGPIRMNFIEDRTRFQDRIEEGDYHSG